MARIRINTYWHASPACGIAEGEKCGGEAVCYPNGGGHISLTAMRRELAKRFKHRKPQKIPNGIRLEADGGRYQDITWEES